MCPPNTGAPQTGERENKRKTNRRKGESSNRRNKNPLKQSYSPYLLFGSLLPYLLFDPSPFSPVLRLSPVTPVCAPPAPFEPLLAWSSADHAIDTGRRTAEPDWFA
jgi:hypothetical protein